MGAENYWEKYTVKQAIFTNGKVMTLMIFGICSSLLFGLDIGYFTAIKAMDSYKQNFYLMRPAPGWADKLENYILYAGAMIATLPFWCVWMLKRFRCRGLIMLGAATFFVGTVMQIICPEVHEAAAGVYWVFMIGRFVMGFGLGWINMATPVYLGESAPGEIRGIVSIMFQMGVVTGIFLSTVIGAGLQDDPNGWRWVILPMCVAGIITFIFAFCMPESPRRLLVAGKYEESLAALKTFRSHYSDEDVMTEFNDMKSEHEAELKSGPVKWGDFANAYLLRLVLAGMACQFLQQFCGVNAFGFFSDKIAGLAGQDAFNWMMTEKGVNFAATFLAVYLVDRIGRKPLMIIGSIGIVCMEAGAGVIGTTQFTFPDQCDKEWPAVPGLWEGGKSSCCAPPRTVQSLNTERLVDGEVDVCACLNYDYVCAQDPAKCTDDWKCGGKKNPGACDEFLGGDNKFKCGYTGDKKYGQSDDGISWGVLTCILIFWVFFAVSWGPLTWIFCAEIFPTKYRGHGTACTTWMNFFATFLVSFVSNYLYDDLQFGAFFFWGGFSVICFLYALWMPETGGKSLEEMTVMLEKKLGAKLHTGVDMTPASQKAKARRDVSGGTQVPEGELVGIAAA